MSTSGEQKKCIENHPMKKNSSKFKQYFQKLTPGEVCTPCHVLSFFEVSCQKSQIPRFCILSLSECTNIKHLGSTLNKWELKA